MTTEFETYMRDWILNDLSSPIAALNGFSKCPYAKTAFLENKVKFVNAETDPWQTADNEILNWNEEKTEVVVLKLKDDITPEKIEQLVNILNDNYMPEDFVFLEDHTQVEEKMNDIVFNNGCYNVLFMQKKSKLDLATKKLEKLGYYKNWTKDYYDEVVSWRSGGS